MSNHTDTQDRGHGESPAHIATDPAGAAPVAPAVADLLREMNWPWPPAPEFFALFRSLVDAGADFHAKDSAAGCTILAHTPSLLQWLPCFEACGLDLTDPVQQAIHGNILPLCLGSEDNALVLELIRLGLFPTPETNWGAAALEWINRMGDRAQPIRAVIEAKTTRDRLLDVLPEVPLSPPAARRL